MKKLFSLLVVCLVVLASCEREPIIVLSENSLEFDAAGGSRTIMVTSNYEWTSSADMASMNPVSVSPQSGLGSGYVTITLGANATDAVINKDIVFSCSSKSSTAMATLHITQACPAGSASLHRESIEPSEDNGIAAEGSVVTFTVTANATWTLVCDASDVVVEPSTSGAGTTTVKATVPTCPVFEGRAVKFTLSCFTTAGGVTKSESIKQAGGIVIYGDEVYHAVQMKDGKWWMKENLRYIPAGMTPSDDLTAVTAGVFFPIVCNNSTLAFSKNADDIKSRGYLYQAEVALGLKVGDLSSVEAAEALNGTRGICPAGWHVPTSDDIMALVGKAVSPLTPNPNAPYYDGNNGSILLLNQDGFNMDAFGAVSIQDNTKTAGSFLGWAKAYPDKISSGMFCGSTYASVTYNTKDVPESGIKNLQFFGFMPMTNKATEAEYTCNGTKVSYRIAAPLRCVKDNN